MTFEESCDIAQRLVPLIMEQCQTDEGRVRLRDVAAVAAMTLGLIAAFTRDQCKASPAEAARSLDSLLDIVRLTADPRRPT